MFQCSCFPLFPFSVYLFLCSCFQMFLFFIVTAFHCSCFSVPVFRCSCFQCSCCQMFLFSDFQILLFSDVPVFRCSHFQCSYLQMFLFTDFLFSSVPVFLFLLSERSGPYVSLYEHKNVYKSLQILSTKGNSDNTSSESPVELANVDLGF